MITDPPDKLIMSFRFYGRFYGRFTVVLLLFCLLLLSPLIQAAPPSPGAVIGPIDKPVFQPQKTQTPKISQDEKTTPVPESDIKVQVNAFEFVGNTTYPDTILKEVIAKYEGQKLSITEIYRAADLVEIYYRYHGYLLTSVYVPAQKINSGTIKLEVIEGRLGEIRIEGELASYEEDFLLSQVGDLQQGEIIDDKALERETLLMGDLPGLETRAIIKPGHDYGTSDVIFVNEEDRYSGVVSVNNFGRKSIGEYRLEGGILIANPLLQGDSLNLSGIVAEDSRMLYGRIDYDAPVNTVGTRVGFSYSAFEYDVDVKEIGLPDGATLEGSGSSIILRVSHPIQRTSNDNTTIIIDGRSSKTKESGNISVRPDNTINLLEVFVNYDHLYSDYAKTSITGGLVTNFQSRSKLTDTDSQKAKLSFDVRHYQPFWRTWFVLGRVQGVYSPDALVDVERFRIGGQGSVRAFPSAELAGDKGGVISVDAGINYVLGSSTVLTPKIFYDAGRVYRIKAIGVPDDESLVGYGAGVSLLFAKDHTIDLEVVEPVTDRESSDGRDTRIWLSYRGFL